MNYTLAHVSLVLFLLLLFTSEMPSSAFEQLRQECLKAASLYEDADFPCIQQSVFYDESPPVNFIWKRPHEITCEPKFICPPGHKSPLPFETIVGKLGDPWFVSAISLLYQSKGLFYRVVPADQSFESHEYAGIFRFRIWWFGQWQEVIVDDRLPINPLTNRPIFIQPLYSSVYWPALLEKAFAKLHGSYEALKYGTSAELLADLTGGATEIFDLTCDPLSNRPLIQQLISISSIVTAVASHDHSDHDLHTLASSQQDDVHQRDLLSHYRNHSSSLSPATAAATATSSPLKFNRHTQRTGDFTGEVDGKQRHSLESANEMSATRSYFYPAPSGKLSDHHHHQRPKMTVSGSGNRKSSSSCSSSAGESVSSSPGTKCHNRLSTVDHPIGVTGSRSNGIVTSTGQTTGRQFISCDENTRALSSSSSSGHSSDNARHSSSSNRREPFHRLPCGLIASINYRITAIEKVEIISGIDSTGIGIKEYIYLVRLVNPMANLSKYIGSFGNKNDHRWSRVTAKDRIKINSIDDENDIVDDIDDIYHDTFIHQQETLWQSKNTKNGVDAAAATANRFNQSHFIYGASGVGTNDAFTSSPSAMSNTSSSSSCGNGGHVTSPAFWIEWSDFTKYFTHLEIVYLDGETSRDEPSLRSKFAMTVKLFRGIWRRGITAGGCRNNQDTFHLNPQIEVTIGPEAEDLLVVCLNQHAVLEPQVVGFSMYKLNNNGNNNNNNKEINDAVSPTCSSGSSSSSCSKSSNDTNKMDRIFFKKNKSLTNSPYSNSRQVVVRCSLNRGSYLLMPTSFECGHEGLFSVRIYSMKGVRLRILDSNNYMSKSAIIKSPASFDVKFIQYEMMFMHLADENNTVNAFELTDLLISSLPNDYVKSCATLDVARMIITAVDTTGLGRIHIRDYKSIMCSLRYWQNIFKNHTKGTTGILRVEKLEDALHDVGFTLSIEIASRLILKYMRKDFTLRFGDFVSTILQLTIAFTSYDKFVRNSKTLYNGSNDHMSSSLPLSNSSSSCISSSFLSNAPSHSPAAFSLSDWLRVSLQT